MNDISELYFEWMINKIFHDYTLRNSYLELLKELNLTPFEWKLAMDENRQRDAQDLRYLFGNECGYSEMQICQELDLIPPSLLEVIVALINRVQDTILYDPENENLNQEIFMDILKSLGLEDLTGNLFNEDIIYLTEVICKFYNHNYSYYGEGSLFTVQRPKADMRDTEIWFQFMWYLNEKLGGKYL